MKWLGNKFRHFSSFTWIPAARCASVVRAKGLHEDPAGQQQTVQKLGGRVSHDLTLSLPTYKVSVREVSSLRKPLGSSHIMIMLEAVKQVKNQHEGVPAALPSPSGGFILGFA